MHDGDIMICTPPRPWGSARCQTICVVLKIFVKVTTQEKCKAFGPLRSFQNKATGLSLECLPELRDTRKYRFSRGLLRVCCHVQKYRYSDHTCVAHWPLSPF